MLAPTHEPTVASVFAPKTRIEADGTVEGYASLFGEIDQARDMVMRGAFAATLATRGVRRVPMLFQHDPSEPVGIWLELREDHRGLYARGRLIPEVARARELLSLLRAGAVDGLSIGFRTVTGRIDPKTRVRRLHGRRSLGNFHRHLPAARGSARAGGERGALPAAFIRPHARRARVDAAGRPRRGGCTRVAAAPAGAGRRAAAGAHYGVAASRAFLKPRAPITSARTSRLNCYWQQHQRRRSTAHPTTLTRG